MDQEVEMPWLEETSRKSQAAFERMRSRVLRLVVIVVVAVVVMV